MNLNQRQTDILNLLIEKGTVYSSDLSSQYSVSTETIRKDFNLLEELGYVQKHHGFATVSEQYTKEALNLDTKRPLHSREKLLIAKKALDFIEDNSVIFCDSGSTVCELAQYLTNYSSLTIVTSSLAIVDAFRNVPNGPHIFLMGGYVNYDYQLTRSMEFDNSVEQFRFAQAFFGTTGVRYHDGPTSSKYREGLVRQRVMRQSDCNIVLCDNSKFKTGGIHQYASWSECDYLITDGIPDEKMKDNLEHQVKVIYCGEETGNS